MRTCLIGIDCATQANKIGLSAVVSEGGNCALLEASTAKHEAPQAFVQRLVSDVRADRILLALDAPMGWPVALGSSLIQHTAGMSLDMDANKLFSRATDHRIRERFDKRPLEVGANLIARTSAAALAMLEEIRNMTEQRFPMLWSPDEAWTSGSVETYPAATLLALGISADGYTKSEAEKKRVDLIEALQPHVNGLSLIPDLSKNQDTLDAVICALGGHRFLMGECEPPPPKNEITQREGWIFA